MSERYNFQIPNINGFKANYYFYQDTKIIDARNYPPHLHDDIEIYVHLEGDASFMVENNVYKLSPGDVVVSRPNEIHNCILHSNSVLIHLCFWLDPSCEFVFRNLLTNGNSLISPSEQDKELLNKVYGELKSASENGETLKQFYLVLQMIDVISRNVKNEEKEPVIPEVLTEILFEMNQKFVEISSLKYYTDKYFISQSTLNRMFKKHLNTSPKFYLEAKRLAYSRILLGQGKTVFEACMQSGFSDYSNYIRLFKRLFEITPKQYQEKLKSQN